MIWPVKTLGVIGRWDVDGYNADGCRDEGTSDSSDKGCTDKRKWAQSERADGLDGGMRRYSEVLGMGRVAAEVSSMFSH